MEENWTQYSENPNNFNFEILPEHNAELLDGDVLYNNEVDLGIHEEEGQKPGREREHQF